MTVGIVATIGRWGSLVTDAIEPMAVISVMFLDLGFKVVIDGSRTLGFNVRIEADRGLRARRGARPAVAIGA